MAAYWLNNVNVGTGVPFAIALVSIAAISLLIRLIGRGGGDVSSMHGVGLALAWAVPAVLVFTAGRTRDTRFVLPVIPAAILIYAVLLDHVRRSARRTGLALIGGHLLLATAAFWVFSFGGPTLRFGPGDRLVASSGDLTLEGFAEHRGIPLEAIVSTTESVLPKVVGRPPLALLLSDTPLVNQNTLTFEAEREGLGITFGLVPYGASLDDAIAALTRADILVLDDGGGEVRPEFTNHWALEVRRRIDAGEIAGWVHRTEPVVRLPDGGVVSFYERKQR